VLSVLFLESSHLAVSTDGFIHVWDPFVGKTVRILDKGTAAKTSQVCSLRPILNTSYFVGAGIDSNIHLVDSRSCSAYELKVVFCCFV
jgi:WD repeat-containing protein 81